MSRNKTAQLLAKGRRKHRYDTLDKIDTCGSLPGVPVEGGVGFHEEGNVCYMDTNIVSTVFIGFDGERVVEISCCFRIDGEDPFLSEIFAGFQLMIRDTRKRWGRFSFQSESGIIYSRPRNRRQAFQYIFGELLGGEIAIFEKGAGFDLNIANGTKFFDKSAERMKGTDGMALDAGDEQLVDICFGVLNEIWGCLLSGNGDERYTLVCWLEPHNLWTFDRSATRFFGTIALAFTSFGFLLFFGCSR